MTMNHTNLEPKEFAELFASAPAKKHAGVQSESRYLAMRDGTRIAVDVMLPAGLAPGARVPVLLVMARYWRSMELRVPDQPKKAYMGPREPIADYLIPRGFAIVAVDARGTGASTGVNRHPWAPDELADYGEVAAWAVAQPWCNGNIGAFGISYEGATAERLAASGVAGVKAVVPQEIEFDVYADIALPGGVFNEAFIRQWNDSNRRLDNNRTSDLFPWLGRMMVKGVRPVDADRPSRATLTQAVREHQANTDVYQAISRITARDDLFGDTGATLDDFSLFKHREAIERSGAALFSWGSWLDGAAAHAALCNFNTFSNPQTVVIGAWKHEMTRHGSPYQKPNAAPDPPQERQWAAVAQFFERTLKHDQPPPSRTLYYYTLGEEAWHQASAFPLPGTERQDWHFQAGHGLSPEAPDENDAADAYTVDFDATTGRTNRWHTQMARPVVYRDRSEADRRLLTYTSAPLERDMEITGYPAVTLHVASTEADNAFFAYLETVDEKGVARYITEGQLRGMHRKLSSAPPPYWTGMPYRTFTRADASPMPPGEWVELTFGLQPTSVLVRRGQRIRVAIGGADKDTFARIPAQGAPIWRISRSRSMASRISLPVVLR
jgi:putative CocE/NonD family hydrolase